jgi:hypothetical protein
LFRRLFLKYLIKAFDAGKLEFFSSLAPLREQRAFLRYLAPARVTEWVVYAKRPFAGPEQVLDYVGRYTHRVASPTIACWTSKTERSPSTTRVIAMTASTRR